MEDLEAKDRLLMFKATNPGLVQKMNCLQRKGFTMREVARRTNTRLIQVHNILYYWKYGENR